MSAHRRRVTTLQALVAGSVVAPRPAGARVHDEFERVAQCGRVRQRDRRWLLQIVHSSRALDTAVGDFTAANGRPNANGTLGRSFFWLRDSLNPVGRRLPEADRVAFQQRVVHVRNHYMHTAGALPVGVHEVTNLLDEMAACLTRILAL